MKQKLAEKREILTTIIVVDFSAPFSIIEPLGRTSAMKQKI